MIIINSGYQGGRDLPVVPKPVVIFYWAMKTFVRCVPGYQKFLPQIPKSTRHSKVDLWQTKTDKKRKIIGKTKNYYNVYFIHIYYELITTLFIYCTHTSTHLNTHTHTHTHTHTRAHICNQFIQFGITLLRGFPTQFQEIKENYQNLSKVGWINFLCNLIK